MTLSVQVDTTFGLAELLEESFAIVSDRLTTNDGIRLEHTLLLLSLSLSHILFMVGVIDRECIWWVIADVKLRLVVVEKEVPWYVTTDRGRLLQLICSLVRHTIFLSDNYNPDDTSARRGEAVVTISLLEKQQQQQQDQGRTFFEGDYGGDGGSRHTKPILPKPSPLSPSLALRRGNLNSSGLKDVALLHVQVQGTTMTILDEEFAGLFDPFTAVAGSRPAKFSSAGLGTVLFYSLRSLPFSYIISPCGVLLCW
jgi:hypothetical protein